MPLDREVVEEILNKYPSLELILLSGVVSMKMTREVLDIDRWLMTDVYTKLLLAQAVYGVTSSSFRATPIMIQYIKERRNAHA